MRSKLLDSGPARTYALVFNRGDEVMRSLLEFARENGIGAAHFTGIGAFSEATLAFFNLDTREYDEIPVAEQAEVLNLTGNLTLFDGKPRVHAHAVLGRPDGSTIGGHMIGGRVEPTLELFVTVLPGAVERAEDRVTGLPLIVP